jgi:hypothetical protein
MASNEQSRERTRAASSDRFLMIFGAVAGAAGALVWLALSLLS